MDIHLYIDEETVDGSSFPSSQFPETLQSLQDFGEEGPVCSFPDRCRCFKCLIFGESSGSTEKPWFSTVETQTPEPPIKIEASIQTNSYVDLNTNRRTSFPADSTSGIEQTEYNPMIPYLHVGLIHVTSSSDEEDGEIAGGSRCAAVALPITRPSMNAQKVLQRERQEETPIVANRKMEKPNESPDTSWLSHRYASVIDVLGSSDDESG